jgi:hypothetical protein
MQPCVACGTQAIILRNNLKQLRKLSRGSRSALVERGACRTPRTILLPHFILATSHDPHALTSRHHFHLHATSQTHISHDAVLQDPLSRGAPCVGPPPGDFAWRCLCRRRICEWQWPRRWERSSGFRRGPRSLCAEPSSHNKLESMSAMHSARGSTLMISNVAPNTQARAVRVAAGRDLWLPGGDAPAYLDGRRARQRGGTVMGAAGGTQMEDVADAAGSADLCVAAAPSHAADGPGGSWARRVVHAVGGCTTA